MAAKSSSVSDISSPISTAPSSSSGGAAGLLARITATSADVGPLVARVALGLAIFPHGAQKALGWFGGYGITGTMGFFTGTLHIPAVFAALAIAAEFLGAIGLIVGGLSRIAAFGIAVNMAVAALVVHAQYGFFINWTGQQAGNGFEYQILAIGLALVVMLKGGGAFSLDRLLARKIGQ
jgi:putative oxidoreductase